jgi:cytochrome b561
MHSNRKNQQWSLSIKILHWLSAVLIFMQIPLGIYAEEMKLSPLKFELFVWHKSLGIVILLVVIVRLLWRMNESIPEPINDNSRQARLANVAHLTLYLLMFLLPLSGWIMSSAANIPINLFWLLELPAITAPDTALKTFAVGVHGICAKLLIAILIVHIGAALRHHFLLHDTALKRMWF